MMRGENIQALFIIIDDPEKLEQVLEVLLECEIRGRRLWGPRNSESTLLPYSHILQLTGSGQQATPT